MAIALILGIKPNQDFALTKPSLATVADKGVSIRRGPRRGLGRWFPVPGCEFLEA